MSGKIRLITIILGVLLTPILLFGQHEIDEMEQSCNSFYNFYSINRLSTVASGRGYSGIADQGNLSLGILNPAAIQLDRTWQIYYELNDKDQVEFQEYDRCVSFDKYKNSKVFGLAFKNHGFNAGIIYYQQASYDFNTCIPCIYNDHLVDSLDYHLQNLVTHLTLPINYTVNDWLKVGAALQFERYESRDPAAIYGQYGISDIIIGKIDLQIVRPRFGINLTPLKNLAVGATFLMEANKSIIKDYGAYYGEVKFKENPFPMQIGAGLKYSMPFAPVNILADFNYSKDSVYDYLKDRSDYNLGVEYTWKEMLTFRTGYYTQMDYRDLDATYEGTEYLFWDDQISYEQNFVTMGLTYRWKGFQFNASYMDSGIMKAGDIEQSYLNVGVAYNI
ncbi:hypothetical protein ACFLYK_00130 [Candidatus Cloacimonadota bacterium]